MAALRPRVVDLPSKGLRAKGRIASRHPRFSAGSNGPPSENARGAGHLRVPAVCPVASAGVRAHPVARACLRSGRRGPSGGRWARRMHATCRNLVGLLVGQVWARELG